MQKILFSVIIPTYNEERAIKDTLLKVERKLEEENFDYELIVADDGSTDATSLIVKKEIVHHQRIKLFSFFPNKGRGYVLSKVFPESKGKIVGYIDADLQIDEGFLVQAFKTFIQKPSIDIVIASKNNKASSPQRSLIRNLATKIYNSIIRVLFDSKVSDHQGGSKFFKKKILFDILPSVQNKGWFWDTEILIIAQQRGARIKEIPIKLNITNHSSKVTMIKDIFNAIAFIFILFKKGEVNFERRVIKDSSCFQISAEAKKTLL